MYICINKYESCTHPKMIKLTLFFRTSYSLEAPKKAHTKEKKNHSVYHSIHLCPTTIQIARGI